MIKLSSKIFDNVSAIYNLLDESFRLHFPRLLRDLKLSAHTADCPVAAAENAEEKLYAIQFHPEVLHTVEGTKMINNFREKCVRLYRRLEDGCVCREARLKQIRAESRRRKSAAALFREA